MVRQRDFAIKDFLFCFGLLSVFGLVAGIAYFAFGGDAGDQVVDFAQSLIVTIAFFLIPVLLVYFILIPFHRAFRRATTNAM